jgi:hypothetical protein
MTASVVVEIEMPPGWETFHMPGALQRRLHALLDRQDEGQTLTPEENQEAQGLVDLAEWLSLLRLQATRVTTADRAN